MQVSGGHLLPPVQTLVATAIFAKSENVSQIPLTLLKERKPHPLECGLIFSSVAVG